MKNVLIACEESQRVCIEFRKRGFNAFSCDIQSCSGGHPEWHIKDDVTYILEPYRDENMFHIMFETEDGNLHSVPSWDLIIAHPPCTDLAVSGARHFERKRLDGSQFRSIQFFLIFTNLSCKHVAIENPVSIMSTIYRKPDQCIQPWMFGHGEVKRTCFWLKDLPKLFPTNIVDGREPRVWKMGSNHSKERSKTYPGIAKAMAEQWGDFINDKSS